jgi:FkbM family methyltransferase
MEYLTSNNIPFRYNFENVAISSKSEKNNLLKFNLNNQFEGSGSSLNPLFAKNRYYNFSRKIFFLKKNLFKIIKVPSLNFIQFKNKKKIKNFTLLKIDAEGLELDILKSAGKQLKYRKIIYVEISALKNKFDIKEKKIANLLYKQGYVRYTSVRIIEGSFFTNLKLCDVLFVKEKYLKLLNSSL